MPVNRWLYVHPVKHDNSQKDASSSGDHLPIAIMVYVHPDKGRQWVAFATRTRKDPLHLKDEPGPQPKLNISLQGASFPTSLSVTVGTFADHWSAFNGSIICLHLHFFFSRIELNWFGFGC